MDNVISEKTSVTLPVGIYIKVIIALITLILGCKTWYENDQKGRDTRIMEEVNTKLDVELYKRDQELTEQKLNTINEGYIQLNNKIDSGFKDIKGDMKFMIDHLTGKEGG